MILGKQIYLRAIEDHDLEFLQSMLNDPEVSRMVGGFSFPVSLTSQRRWYERSLQNERTQRWIVARREDDARLGLTGLWEIDYQSRSALTALKLASQSDRGRGLGTDAIKTVAAFAFDQLGLHRLWSEILTYNTASLRAYVDKCSFRVEGVSRQSAFRDGRFHDQARIALLAEEYRSTPAYDDYRAVPLEPTHTARENVAGANE